MTSATIAVVGCGAVVDHLYRRPLRKLEKRGLARVVALVDPNPARTARLRSDFASARAFTSPHDALAALKPALVIVTSPPSFHAAHAAIAFASGSDVLCEKPLAISMAEGEAMVAAGRLARRTLAVGLVRRIFPWFGAARALIASGSLGDELRFTYREGGVYGWPVSSDAPFHRSTAGGGVLTDLGSHVIDTMVGLFGDAEVRSYADDARGDGVETNCKIEIACARARGTVQLSWNQPLVTGLQVIGSAGELVLDPGRLEPGWWRVGRGTWRRCIAPDTWPIDLGQGARRVVPVTVQDCIYQQIVQVLRARAYGEDVAATGEDALRALRVIADCYATAAPLEMPWLGTAEQVASDGQHWSRRTCAAA